MSKRPEYTHIVEHSGPLSDPDIAFQTPLCGVSALDRTISVVPIADAPRVPYLCPDCVRLMRPPLSY